eukprot:10756616-Alexandrium_andersonii.AAC.1
MAQASARVEEGNLAATGAHMECMTVDASSHTKSLKAGRTSWAVLPGNTTANPAEALAGLVGSSTPPSL